MKMMNLTRKSIFTISLRIGANRFSVNAYLPTCLGDYVYLHKASWVLGDQVLKNFFKENVFVSFLRLRMIINSEKHSTLHLHVGLL